MGNYFIGLMSGTSMDSIDAAVVSFDPQLHLITTHSETINTDILKHYQTIVNTPTTTIVQLAELEQQITHAFINATLALLDKTTITSNQITAIGCHGQTLWHQPTGDRLSNWPFSWQLLDPNQLTEHTQITTVSDFRRRDIAAGGQGAPLTPSFHQTFFHSKHQDRVILNIGGIANITYLNKENTCVIGFDTGPGNTLLDHWIQQHHQTPYDKNGSWAQQGEVQTHLLKKLLNDPYFQQPNPKSTGPEYFNINWLEERLGSLANYAPEDIQSTLAELTAQSIMQAIQATQKTVNAEIYVCGGGIHNQDLIKRMKQIAKEQPIHSTETLGVAPDWVEAVAFAWLAQQTLQHHPSNLPEVTGATHRVPLGCVCFK